MAGSCDHFAMDVQRSPSDSALLWGSNAEHFINVSKTFYNTLEKHEFTATNCNQDASGFVVQPSNEKTMDAQTLPGKQRWSKVEISPDLQGKIAEQELFEDILNMDEDCLDNPGNVSEKDILDDFVVDLRGRGLVHVSQDKLENQAACQTKIFHEASAKSSYLGHSTMKAYDGINFTGVSNDIELSKGAESTNLSVHTARTFSLKGFEKVHVPREKEDFNCSQFQSVSTQESNFGRKVVSEVGGFGKLNIAVDKGVDVGCRSQNQVTQTTRNPPYILHGYPENLPFRTAVNQHSKTSLTLPFQPAENTMSKTVEKTLSQTTVTLPPQVAGNVSSQRVENPLSKTPQNLPAQISNVLSQTAGNLLPQTVSSLTPTISKEMLSQIFDSPFSHRVNSLSQTVESLYTNQMPQTAQNLQPHTAEHLTIPTAENLQPKQAMQVAVPPQQEMQVAVPSQQEVQVAVLPQQEVQVAVPQQKAQLAVPQQKVQVAVPPQWEVQVSVPPQQGWHVAVPPQQKVQVADPPKQKVQVSVPPQQEWHVVVPPQQEIQVVVPSQQEAVLPQQEWHAVVPPQQEIQVVVPSQQEAVLPQQEWHVAVPIQQEVQVAVPSQQPVQSYYTGPYSPMSVCSNSSTSLSRSQNASSILSDTDKKYHTCSQEVKLKLLNKVRPCKGQGQQDLKRFHPYRKSNATLPDLHTLLEK